jgi:membrane associated rhomboid family serine protease
VQCVDCVNQGAREVRTTRTIFGGSMNPRGAVVTYSIMAICVVVYIAELVSPAVFQRFAFSPATGASEPWRALTAAFLHSPQTFLHIVFNMLCLWQIGPYLEGLLGRLRFLVLYLVCAVGGSAGFLLLATPPTAADPIGSWNTGVVGASGAVFGLFGALLVLNRHLGRSTAGIGVMILINAVFGFIYPGIAWQAHLGGFVTGLACAGVIALLNREHLRRYAVLGMLGVLVVVVALMAAKYATVPTFLIR